MNQRDHLILKIAIPSIVSNVTVPLLGLIDVAIVGHLGAAAYIAAISIGSMVFNTTYWIFGFLRMGSSGLTSQALGRRDMQEVTLLLLRSLCIAFMIASALLVLQMPLRELALLLMQPSDEVSQLVKTYYHICIWGAPAMLGLYSMNGWFIGMQNSRIPMVVAVTQNVVNIIVSLGLVFGIGMKVDGVATGTLVAQWTGFLLAVVLCRRHYGRHLRKHLVAAELRGLLKKVFSRQPMLWFFHINRDIFLRTLCLVSVMLFFTSAGSWQGEVVLAANTLLMQLYLLVSYVMDGFANAAEAMSGKYWGAENGSAFRDTVARCFKWGAACTLLFTVVYVVGGESFLALLTDEPTVIHASREYVWWAYLIPVCSIGAFIWDGVFIGITASRGMFISSFIAAAAFFILYYSLHARFGNHGLWFAMNAYLFIRGAVQTVIYYRSIVPVYSRR
ncbi:MAG: MATE family efflux transporter [Prevotella sp.]|nr:MATE family efflux transporter [Prevotella sp.]